MDDPEQDANASLGEGRPRPVCPECGMRMITNIVETLRSLECLRCGHVEDEQA
jgi:DNA-directed RNA polymerase subunit RPC12/RpoP